METNHSKVHRACLILRGKALRECQQERKLELDNFMESYETNGDQAYNSTSSWEPVFQEKESTGCPSHRKRFAKTSKLLSRSN